MKEPTFNIERTIECEICVEAFSESRKPKILACGHTFCQQCLQDIRIQKSGIVCPKCKQKDKRKTESLATNQLILQLSEIQKGILQEKKTKLQNNCELHQQELVRYCKQCSQVCCIICEQVGEHKQHAIQDLQVACQDFQPKFTKLKKMLKEKRKKFYQFKQFYEKSLQDINNNYTNYSQQVNQYTTQLLEDIQNQAQQKLQKAEQEYKNAYNCLEERLDYYQNSQNSIDQIENLIQRDVSHFLINEEQIKKLAFTSIPEMPEYQFFSYASINKPNLEFKNEY